MKSTVFAISFSLVSAGGAHAAPSCLHYMGEPVTLVGAVKLQTFYGPPGYGENSNTDSRETQAVLNLSSPICVDENVSDGDDAEKNQSLVTLVPVNNENLKPFAGKTVEVQGSLFHAMTGHHHTPVLIQIKKIKVSGG